MNPLPVSSRPRGAVLGALARLHVAQFALQRALFGERGVQVDHARDEDGEADDVVREAYVACADEHELADRLPTPRMMRVSQTVARETALVAQQVDAEDELDDAADGVDADEHAHNDVGVQVDLFHDLLHAEHHADDEEDHERDGDNRRRNEQDAVNLQQKRHLLTRAPGVSGAGEVEARSLFSAASAVGMEAPSSRTCARKGAPDETILLSNKLALMRTRPGCPSVIMVRTDTPRRARQRVRGVNERPNTPRRMAGRGRPWKTG